MALSSFLLLSYCLLCIFSTTVHSTSNDFYTLSSTDITGRKIDLEDYRGKITLVVNVASECGYTDHNYHELNLLQDKYGFQKVAILAFPCNQFGFQEPGENEYIESLVRSKYKINFHLFAKTDITGPQQSDIYKHLIKVTGQTPGWNFCKYLINGSGSVVKFFTQSDSFEDIYKSIDQLLLSSNKKEL